MWASKGTIFPRGDETGIDAITNRRFGSFIHTKSKLIRRRVVVGTIRAAAAVGAFPRLSAFETPTTRTAVVLFRMRVTLLFRSARGKIALIVFLLAYFLRDSRYRSKMEDRRCCIVLYLYRFLPPTNHRREER